ncbi:protein kinase [Candidatus Uabimicrobium sp. HlEnr_7]|uniref:serine/threonine-protein kinase n=1 Tax=Candidatus Uabimicrobium helgolandensis TaxID=3095367 RepID=UPI0035592D43
MATKNQSTLHQNANISTFAHYKILSELGRGGMGCVYKAFDTKLQRTVALKVLISQNQTNTEQIQRFIIEARATAKLVHPNIVRVYEIGNEKGIAFFTMDCIEGSSLKEIIKSKKLNLHKGLAIMKKVSEAMYYAHQNGIIHRDLKPANIMIDKKGEPYVMDFGLAKTLNSDKKLTKTGMIVGTLFYMPPEQVEGKHREIDQRSDIYSLGVIIYEMITGRVPHYSNTTLTVLKKITQDPIQVPSTVAKNRKFKTLDYICLKALAKKKKNRYENANDLAQDLERFIQGKPIIRTKQLPKKSLVIIVSIIIFIGGMFLTLSTKKTSDNTKAQNNIAKKIPNNKKVQNNTAKKNPSNKKVQKKIKSNPHASENYNNSGNAKDKKGDLAGAIKDFSKAIELNPHNSWAYNGRGNVKRKLKDLTGAVQDFNKAIELDPNNSSWAHYNRGLIKVQLDDLTGAVQDFSKSIELDPKNPWGYNDRANVFKRQKKYQRAVSDFKKFLELNPNNFETRKILRFIKRHSK